MPGASNERRSGGANRLFAGHSAGRSNAQSFYLVPPVPLDTTHLYANLNLRPGGQRNACTKMIRRWRRNMDVTDDQVYASTS